MGCSYKQDALSSKHKFILAAIVSPTPSIPYHDPHHDKILASTKGENKDIWTGLYGATRSFSASYKIASRDSDIQDLRDHGRDLLEVQDEQVSRSGEVDDGSWQIGKG